MKRNRKLGILYLIEAMHPGGAERQLCELINGLDRSKFEVYLITWIVKTNFFKLNNVTWHSFNRSNKIDLRPIIRAAALLKSGQVDIVHGFLDTGNLYAATAKLLAGKGIVVASERSSHRELTYLQKVHKPWSHKRAHLTISNSQKGKLFLNTLGIPSQKVQVIKNGINTEIFSPDSQRNMANIRSKLGLPIERKFMATVGRITHVKNQLDIIKAYQMSKIRNQYDLIFIGGKDHQYVTELKLFIRKYHLESNVHFLDPMADVVQFYALADFLVLYSIREGTSNMLFEAMACGKPVVSAMVGDCSNYIEHGSTGWVVPPCDFKKLASTFNHIAELRRKEIRAMGIKARQQLLGFDVDHQSMVKKFEETYYNLVAEEL